MSKTKPTRLRLTEGGTMSAPVVGGPTLTLWPLTELVTGLSPSWGDLDQEPIVQPMRPRRTAVFHHDEDGNETGVGVDFENCSMCKFHVCNCDDRQLSGFGSSPSMSELSPFEEAHVEPTQRACDPVNFVAPKVNLVGDVKPFLDAISKAIKRIGEMGDCFSKAVVVADKLSEAIEKTVGVATIDDIKVGAVVRWIAADDEKDATILSVLNDEGDAYAEFSNGEAVPVGVMRFEVDNGQWLLVKVAPTVIPITDDCLHNEGTACERCLKQLMRTLVQPTPKAAEAIERLFDVDTGDTMLFGDVKCRRAQWSDIQVGIFVFVAGWEEPFNITEMSIDFSDGSFATGQSRRGTYWKFVPNDMSGVWLPIENLSE